MDVTRQEVRESRLKQRDVSELQQLVSKIRKCHVCCVIACFFPLVLPCMFYREAHSVMQIGSQDKLLMFVLSDPLGAKSSL